MLHWQYAAIGIARTHGEKCSTNVPAILQAYFSHHATVIQKCWRGHHSRAHIHDFYKRKAFLQSAAAASAAVRAGMEAELQAALQHQQQEAQAAAKQAFDAQVRGTWSSQHRSG